MSGRSRQSSSGAASCSPIVSSNTCGGGSANTCSARHKAVRIAVLSGAGVVGSVEMRGVSGRSCPATLAHVPVACSRAAATTPRATAAPAPARSQFFAEAARDGFHECVNPWRSECDRRVRECAVEMRAPARVRVEAHSPGSQQHRHGDADERGASRQRVQVAVGGGGLPGTPVNSAAVTHNAVRGVNANAARAAQKRGRAQAASEKMHTSFSIRRLWKSGCGDR